MPPLHSLRKHDTVCHPLLLFCLIRIAKNFFSNDPFSCLIQILIPYDSNCTTIHFRRMPFWEPDPMA
jgi:hypothetical protein